MLYMVEMLKSQEVDLVVTTNRPDDFECLNLGTSPTHWYCAARIYPAKGRPVPLVLLDDQPVSRYRAGDVECRTDPVASGLCRFNIAYLRSARR